MFDFDHPPDRHDSDSVKWARYAGTDILPMWVADMDFASPPPVVEALRRRVDHGVFGYGGGPVDLKYVIANWIERRHGWKIDPEWIVYVPGVMIGMSAAMRMLTEPGDEVITTTPIYPPFLRLPPHLGRRRVDVPMIEPGVSSDGRWQVDIAALGRAFDGGAKGLMWCNPHNPSGRIFLADEQRAVAEVCLAHEAIIYSDEIHCDLLLEPGQPHVPMASLSSEIAERTLTFMAPSKTFNVPGLSFSFAIIPENGLRRRFRHALLDVVPWPNILGYVAARAAYAEGDAWLDALLSYLRENRDLVMATIADLPQHGGEAPPAAVKVGAIEATYLAWIDVRGLGLENPQKHFEQHGLGLMDGREFEIGRASCRERV